MGSQCDTLSRATSNTVSKEPMAGTLMDSPPQPSLNLRVIFTVQKHNFLTLTGAQPSFSYK